MRVGERDDRQVDRQQPGSQPHGPALPAQAPQRRTQPEEQRRRGTEEIAGHAPERVNRQREGQVPDHRREEPQCQVSDHTRGSDVITAGE